jgi:hypothetical protein
MQFRIKCLTHKEEAAAAEIYSFNLNLFALAGVVVVVLLRYKHTQAPATFRCVCRGRVLFLISFFLARSLSHTKLFVLSLSSEKSLTLSRFSHLYRHYERASSVYICARRYIYFSSGTRNTLFYTQSIF